MTDSHSLLHRFKYSSIALFLFLGSWGSGEALAQGASIKLGETDLTPNIRLEYYSDSNVFRESTDENDATGVRIKPTLEWLATSGLTELKAEYEGVYSTSGIESTDFQDHILEFSGKTEFTKRSRLKGGLRFSRITEELGTGLSIGVGEAVDLNIANQIQFDLEHTYGAVSARGNITTGIQLRDVSYSGNEDLTNRSDFSEIEPYARFSYRLGGSTRAFTELRYILQDYELNTDDRDQLQFFVGTRWLESEAFGASAKVGLLSYTYPSNSARDGNDLGLEIGGFYRPTSFSQFDLAVNRKVADINDSVDTDNSATALTDRFTLVWEYGWSSRLSHRAGVSLDIIERDNCSDNEVTTETSIELVLGIQRWLSIGGGAGLESRKFDGCNGAIGTGDLDYDKEIFELFISMSL